MKRFLCVLGLSVAALLATIGRSSLWKILRYGDHAEAVQVSGMMGAAALLEHDVSASDAAWAQRIVGSINDMDDTSVDLSFTVQFGLRTLNAASGEYEIRWGDTPANVVKVVARRGDAFVSDSETVVPVAFTGVFNRQGSLLQAEAIAYMDAPDGVGAVDHTNRPREAP